MAKRNKIKKAQEEKDKVGVVMDEFKKGKLKSSNGKTVTDKDQAVAIALSEAGISRKSLELAEILNKVRVLKSQAYKMLYKELAKDESVESAIIEYFKNNKNPKDKEVHALAEKIGVDPDVVEEKIYSILASFIGGGKSQGDKKEVDPKELEMGREVEQEHSSDPAVIDKIVRDHLAEQSDYYTKLKEVESKSKEEKK